MIVGETRTVTATFRLSDGTLIDPSAVAFTVQDPSGVQTSPAVTNTSVGVYAATINFDEAGIWYWRWEGDTAEGTVASECSACATAASVVVA